MKYKQILANLVEFKLVDFKEVDSLIGVLDKNLIRELIMNLQSKSGDKIFIAIEQSSQRDLTLCAKRKFKAEAEVFSVHIAVQLAQLDEDSILTKLDLDI